MKKIFFTVSLILLSAIVFSQTKVNAKEILKKINNGEKVHYKNCEITGNLHLYDLDNLDHEKDNMYYSFAKAEVIFENCTFRGKVLGYFYDEYEKEVSAVQFEDEVAFRNCVFRKEVNFKYTEFGKQADFSGSKFHREINFKYAFFTNSIDFSDVNFVDDVNFKYTEFNEEVNFSKSVFERDANFKYTKFDGGVNFKDSEFEDEPNFKYAKIKGRKAKNKLYRMTY